LPAGDVKEKGHEAPIFAGLAAVLIAGELIGSAPQANAGCQYGESLSAGAMDRSSPTAPGSVACYSTR
jgi:hypothetical protein